MLASLAAQSDEYNDEITQLASEFGEEAAVVVRVLAAVMRGDHDRIKELWPIMRHALADKQLLYVPLSKEGDVRQIVAALPTMPIAGLAGLAAAPRTVGRDMQA